VTKPIAEDESKRAVTIKVSQQKYQVPQRKFVNSRRAPEEKKEENLEEKSPENYFPKGAYCWRKISINSGHRDPYDAPDDCQDFTAMTIPKMVLPRAGFGRRLLKTDRLRGQHLSILSVLCAFPS
ncbi:hypothetical protein K0M31_014064, partial [Melipona bicolor]